MPAHNPNPFDFVPFAKGPYLHTRQNFDDLGDHLTGYLQLHLEALTPLHIMGYQTTEGDSGTSHIYRQNGAACIPGASIRGCLRTFVEALTSGWVSQANLEYPKKDGHKYPNEGRHIGYRTFEPNSSGKAPVIDKEYKPTLLPDNRMDLASYLFGIVLEEPKGSNSEHTKLTYKSKVLIEDALIEDASVEVGENWAPDVAGKSFMGGSKPSASTWWYMQPEKYQLRPIRSGKMKTAEFVGKKFWGRKFYYHQEPQACLEYYKKNWKFAPESPLYPVHLECQKRGTSTTPFRIYLEDIPRPLAILCMLALLPGRAIRHKLGYGKAYGYGSVEFHIDEAFFRPTAQVSRLPEKLENYAASGELKKWTELAWQKDALAKAGLDESILDFTALASLARVLGWPEHEKVHFTYPPYAAFYFKQPVSQEQYNQATRYEKEKSATKVAEALFEVKKTIHFRYYQEHASGWDIIKNRQP